MASSSSSTTLPPSTLRQMEDRSVEAGVSLMVWSPKMDILALALLNGAVVLYRLNWQRIWTCGPSNRKPKAEDPDEVKVRVNSIAWRPDGKTLAVGYDSGELRLLDIESNEPKLKMSLEGEVSALFWISVPKKQGEPQGISGTTDWSFLTKFPLLSKAYSSSASESSEELKPCHKFDPESPDTILVCGTSKGMLNLYMNGYLLCSKINLNELLNKTCKIKSIVMSPDLGTFSILSRGEEDSNDSGVSLHIVENPLISACYDELTVLSRQYSTLQGMLDYMDGTLKQLSEAWEEIVLELDNKLENLAKKLPEGGLAADFLELLLFGFPSAEVEQFLAHELTEKGVKKLDHSIEVSYLNVQRLVQRYLQVVVQSISFHLSQLSGFAKACEKFNVIGVTVENVAKAQRQSASLWAKSMELQQVLEESRSNFHTFFRWLQREICRLGDDNIPDEINKVSQQDVSFIADFLYNFDPEEPEDETEGRISANGNKAGVAKRDGDEDGMESDSDSDNLVMAESVESSTVTHKHLERVGQYLQDSPLEQVVDRSKNPWVQFLDANPDFKEEKDFILHVDPKTSLVQEFNAARDAIQAIFDSMSIDMTDKSRLAGTALISQGQGHVELDQYVCGDGRLLGAVFPTSRSLFVFEFCSNNNLRGLWLTPPPEFDLQDARFYTSDTLSLLLAPEASSNSSNARLIQFPVERAEVFYKQIPLTAIRAANARLPEDAGPGATKPISSVVDASCHRDLENATEGSILAVSGPRKVASVLFRSRKRIRIYDMEIEDDDEDEEDDEDEMNSALGTSGLSSEN